MGARGLPKQLHECGGAAGCSCKDTGKPTHVDFLCRFFRLLNARAFKVVQHHAKTSTLSPQTKSVPELPLETEAAAGSKKRKNTSEHHPSTNTPSPVAQVPFDRHQTLDEMIEKSIVDLGYKDLFLSSDGLSPVGTEKDQEIFRAVGFVLDDVLSKMFDKARTVLHVDGRASEQKRGEHRRRNATLKKSLDKLQKKVANVKTRSSKELFRSCRNLYRLPRSMLEQDVLPVLTELGWQIHFCAYQADTCLAKVCQDATEPDSITIVTSDSDLMVYEAIQNVMMPVGKTHELQGFNKKKLLEHLDLPSDQHFLLACIVTSNDYVQNIPYFGLLTNCEIVRDIDLSELPPLGSLENDDRAKAMMPYVQGYLCAVQDRLETRPKRATASRQKQQDIIGIGADYYQHAVTAFVAMKETPMLEPMEPEDN
ncbi:hypothetical protein BGX30_007561, partial [Mortierella sp. GBA39]